MEGAQLTPWMAWAVLALVLINTAVLLWLALRRQDDGADAERLQRDDAARKELLAAVATQTQSL